MRIVFISTMDGYPWGGSEELWSRAAARLHREGHQIAAFVHWWPELSPMVLALRAQGVEVFAHRPASQSPLMARALYGFQNRFGLIPRRLHWLRRQRPDLVVISHGANGIGCEWMRFCREAGFPYICLLQCNTEAWWPDDRVIDDSAASFRTAKQVFCVSRHNLELLQLQLAESLPNARVVWNPCNVPTNAPPPWPKQDTVWRLASVARLDPTGKGQDLLLQVLAQPRWRERPVECSFFGAGRFECALKKLAAHLQVKNVSFRGQVGDVLKIWAENHLLVLFSRFEGLPLALIEAMWCERPSVVTDIAGNAEACVDGETGFVAPAPTLKLVAETMERAWNQREHWKVMGQAARRRAELLVPQDPVGEFCAQLLECASKSSKHAT